MEDQVKKLQQTLQNLKTSEPIGPQNTPSEIQPSSSTVVKKDYKNIMYFIAGLIVYHAIATLFDTFTNFSNIGILGVFLRIFGNVLLLHVIYKLVTNENWKTYSCKTIPFMCRV